VLSSLTACISGAETDSSSLPSSSGKYGEVLVVIDTAFENGPVGEKIREIFQAELSGTPQAEPLFRMSTVDPDYFKSILKRSRNLFKLSIKKKNQNKVSVDRNVWAKDQLLINVYADSPKAALRMLEKNTSGIRDYFNEEEIMRLQKQFDKQLQEDLMSDLEQKLGVELKIPPAFVKMGTDSNVVWLKKEKSIGQHTIIQGLVVYTQDYTSKEVFSDSVMIASRDQVTRTLIEGFRDNSFMKIYDELPLFTEEINLGGYYSKEYRGLWHMENDFMGGPFLHYTLVDEENQKVIHLDGFVYAPKFNKREYLRELEAIIKGMKLSVSSK